MYILLASLVIASKLSYFSSLIIFLDTPGQRKKLTKQWKWHGLRPLIETWGLSISGDTPVNRKKQWMLWCTWSFLKSNFKFNQAKAIQAQNRNLELKAEDGMNQSEILLDKVDTSVYAKAKVRKRKTSRFLFSYIESYSGQSYRPYISFSLGM